MRNDLLHTRSYLVELGTQFMSHKLKSYADPEGGGDRGSGPPLENYKNIGFLSNIEPDPLKITKLPVPIQHIQCWAIIGTPAKRHLNGVLQTGR